MSRVYNFSAGPAMLPEEVLKEAADEMLDYRGCGMSVMEMSHRSKAFDEIIKEAEAGSAGSDADSGQLQGAVPAGRRVPAVCGDSHESDEEPQWPDYIVTGQWAKKAFARRQRSTGRPLSWHPPMTRPSPTFRTAPICTYPEDAGLCLHL